MEIHSQSRPEGRAKSCSDWRMASIDRTNYTYTHSQQQTKQKKTKKKWQSLQPSAMTGKHQRQRRVALLERCGCKANGAAWMRSFLQLKISPLGMKLLLCVGKPTNWEWGKNNVVCEVFSVVKHSVFVGRFSPSLPLPSPTDKSFCPQ